MNEPTSARALCSRLAQSVEALNLLPEAGDREEFLDRRTEALRVLRFKLFKDLGSEASDPLLVVVSGGTNVGKSTVFNCLVGDDLAGVTPLARGTKLPLVAGESQYLDIVLGDRLLPGYARGPYADAQELNREDPGAEDQSAFRYAFDIQGLPEGLVFVDSPDVDSERTQNRRIAEDLIFSADVIVFVVSATKYRDEAVQSAMRRAAQLGRRLCVVWNPWEQDQEPALEHFQQHFFEEDLKGLLDHEVPIFRLPPVNGGHASAVGDELQDLVTHLEACRLDAGKIRGAGLERAAARFKGGVDELVERLREERALLDRIRTAVDKGRVLALEDYRRSVRAISVEQISQAYEVVWQKTRVPLIDPMMDHAYALLRKALWLLGFKAPEKSERPEDEVSERDRVALRTLLQQHVDQVDRQIAADADPRYEELIRDFRQRVLSSNLDANLGGLATTSLRARREWLDARVADTLQGLQENPGRYYMITALRTLLTVVPTVLAVWYVGAFAAIIVLIPVVHGIMSQIVKRILFNAYVVRHKSNLEKTWIEAIRTELDRGYVHDVLSALPGGTPEVSITSVAQGTDRLEQEVESFIESIRTSAIEAGSKAHEETP